VPRHLVSAVSRFKSAERGAEAKGQPPQLLPTPQRNTAPTKLYASCLVAEENGNRKQEAQQEKPGGV